MFDTESEPERELWALGAEGSVQVGGCNERASPVGVWMSCRLCVCVCVWGLCGKPALFEFCGGPKTTLKIFCG